MILLLIVGRISIILGLYILVIAIVGSTMHDFGKIGDPDKKYFIPIIGVKYLIQDSKEFTRSRK